MAVVAVLTRPVWSARLSNGDKTFGAWTYGYARKGFGDTFVLQFTFLDPGDWCQVQVCSWAPHKILKMEPLPPSYTIPSGGSRDLTVYATINRRPPSGVYCIIL